MIKLKVENGRKVALKLDTIAKGLLHLKSINHASILTIDRWIQQNFEKEGGKHSESSLKWKPLSPYTLSVRRKGKKAKLSGADVRILQDTGALKTRWIPKSNNKGSSLQSQVKYANDHEAGIRVKNLPKRKILPTEEQGEEIIKPVYQHFIKELLK